MRSITGQHTVRHRACSRNSGDEIVVAVQIATIGLAASTDVVGVTLGGIVGHSICTGAAVVGGRHLATFVDERAMSILGGLLFVAFGAHAYWEVRPWPHSVRS